MPSRSIWSNINTCFEIGLEILRLMEEEQRKGNQSEKDGISAKKGTLKGTTIERLSDGVLLMSNDKEILLAVSEDLAQGTLLEQDALSEQRALSEQAKPPKHSSLSETAISYGDEKDGYLRYSWAAIAIPLYELSKTNAAIRDYIISEESLRATLCSNYPQYVKTHNMTAPPGEQIEDADAPPCLFLQKQLDQAADDTHAEVAEHEMEQANSHDLDIGYFYDEHILD